MRTLTRLWWHSILAMIIGGAGALVGALMADYAPGNIFQGIGALLFVGSLIIGIPGAFIGLELLHWGRVKDARRAATSQASRATHSG